MASGGMFHRGHSQLQLKLRRLQPDLQARVRDWPADFQSQQTMFLVVQDRGRRFSLSASRPFCLVHRQQFSLFQSRPSAKVDSKILYFIYLIVDSS